MTSTIVYEGNLRTKAVHVQSQSILETDAPKDNQGNGERFSPTDLVVTSLGSCMLTIMGIKARDLGLDLTGTKIELLKVMKSEPRRIGAVDLIIHFPAGFTADEKQKTILKNAAINCPVAKTLHPDIEQNITFNW